ncbi:MAG: cell division protein ZapA [Firmicutes bacterium]|nr:cell division protein ZapA [Bacillota bacterium]
MKEKYIVKIAGTEISIITDEKGEYVEHLTRIIDRRITDTVMLNKRYSRLEAAIICALDYLNDKIKLEDELNELKLQNEELRRKLDNDR